MSRAVVALVYITPSLCVVRGPGSKQLVTDVQPDWQSAVWSKLRSGWTLHSQYAADLEALASFRGFAISVVGAPADDGQGVLL